MSTAPEVEPASPPLARSKPAFLRRVKIRGYKSIAFCDVTLEPLTILVGPGLLGPRPLLLGPPRQGPRVLGRRPPGRPPATRGSRPRQRRRYHDAADPGAGGG